MPASVPAFARKNAGTNAGVAGLEANSTGIVAACEETLEP